MSVIMKRIIPAVVFCLFAVALLAQRVGDTLYVNVKSADLKSSTGVFASSIDKLEYTDEVRVLAVSADKKWVQVNTSVGNKTGWVAYSGLTSRRMARSSSANASATEIALAGKGFSPEVESEYKKSESGVNYDAVDNMEGLTVPENELFAFMEEGRLIKGE